MTTNTQHSIQLYLCEQVSQPTTPSRVRRLKKGIKPQQWHREQPPQTHSLHKVSTVPPTPTQPASLPYTKTSYLRPRVIKQHRTRKISARYKRGPEMLSGCERPNRKTAPGLGDRTARRHSHVTRHVLHSDHNHKGNKYMNK